MYKNKIATSICVGLVILILPNCGQSHFINSTTIPSKTVTNTYTRIPTGTDTPTVVPSPSATSTIVPLPSQTSTIVLSPSDTLTLIQSPKLKNIIHQPLKSGTVILYGNLFYGESVITNITNEQPEIETVDVAKNEYVNYPIAYDNHTGEFLVTNVPAGKYQLHTRYHFSKTDPFPQPGDLDAWTVIGVEASESGMVIRSDVHLDMVIHLTAPENNSGDLGWANPGAIPSYDQGKLQFTWEPIAGADHYIICFTEVIPGPSSVPQELGCFTLTATSYAPDLPSSNGSIYQVKINGYDLIGNEIGILMCRINADSWSSFYAFEIN